MAILGRGGMLNHDRPWGSRQCVGYKKARRTRRGHVVLLSMLAAAVSWHAIPSGILVCFSDQSAPTASLEVASSDRWADALNSALGFVDSWNAQIARGRVIDRFGQRAQSLIEQTAGACGGDTAEVASALDGVLQGLFLHQLRLIQDELLRSLARSRGQELVGIMAKADGLFSARARILMPPGSSWDYKAERLAFLAALKARLQHTSSIDSERFRSAEMQRTTASVVRRLQEQMEELEQKLGGRTASSWSLWTSCRVPGTPFQMSGQYQGGRTRIQLSMSPSKNPARAEAGFVEGLTPEKVGLAVNLNI